MDNELQTAIIEEESSERIILSVDPGNSANLTLSSLSADNELEGILNYFKGDKGDTGLSAFEEWLTHDGNQGKEFDEFLEDINCDINYVRDEPCLVNIGGIKKGQTFNYTIQEVFDALFYPTIDPTLIATVDGGKLREIGSVVSKVKLLLDLDLGSYTFYSFEVIKDNSLSVHTTYSQTNYIEFVQNSGENANFKVKMIYKSDTSTSSIYSNTTTLKFVPKIYWGTSELQTYDSNFILGLENSVLTETTQRTINVNAGQSEYIYYVLPSSYTEPKFVFNGFEGGFIKEETITFTNSYGYSSSYDIWRSNHKNLGSLTVTIK